MATPEKEALRRIEACYKNQEGVLNLSGLGLNELPAEIGRLQHLSTLDLNANRLSTLPTAIGQLQNLSKLLLSSNRLTELPAAVGQLRNLSQLYLTSNQLKTLPPAIGQLQKLSTLYLSSNQLVTLPAEIGQLQNLFRLYLDNNQLVILPAAIGRLQKLSTLYLSANQLITLPAEIGQLQNLHTLYLGSNHLRELPAEIGWLGHLSTLCLGSNQLSRLPTEIKQLQNLSEFDLSNNRLRALPADVTELKLNITWKWGHELKSSEMTIKDNYLAEPPLEIIQQGNKAIITYLVEKHKKPLNEVKILLVGDGSAGKTSLLRRLVGQDFNPKESQTHGINIQPYKIMVRERDITLNYWDFGGQEVMHHTHQFFLSKRSLYILLLDGRKEEEPEYWLDYIQTLGGDSPVLVALNKIDQNPSFEVNRADLHRKYPNIDGFFRISCKDNIDIETLRQALYRAIFKVEMLETMWPGSWFAVKQVLEKLQKPFINEAEYIKLCKNNKVIDETAQDTLVEFLDQLGIVLHFKQLDLCDVHVLEPHWVTEAVYRIINHKRLAQAKGVLNLNNLPELLKRPKTSGHQYPRNVHYYIITLMKEFELCYELNPKQRLVPDLLPVQESKFEFNENNALRFIFTYQFMPRSIMPRFIVKRHKDIKNGCQWRTGVILQHSKTGAEAVVRSDKKNRKIEIMVNGSQKRDYFAVIRDTLWDIHHSFEVDKLGIEERIPLPGFPNHTVEYAELVGLERIGVTHYVVGKLNGSKFSVAELLNGVESQAARAARSKGQGNTYNIQQFYGDNHIGQGIGNMNQSKTHKVGNITISGHSGNIAGVGITEGNISQTIQTPSFSPERQQLQALVAQLTQAIACAAIDDAQKVALQSQLPALEQAKDQSSVNAALNMIQTIANTMENAEKITTSATEIAQFLSNTTSLLG